MRANLPSVRKATNEIVRKTFHLMPASFNTRKLQFFFASCFLTEILFPAQRTKLFLEQFCCLYFYPEKCKERENILLLIWELLQAKAQNMPLSTRY
jgi:hypothetical protein